MVKSPLVVMEKSGKKLRNNNCTAICIVPDWERGWIKELIRGASKKCISRKAHNFLKWAVNLQGVSSGEYGPC
jgi:hypothetical protein